MTLTEFAKEHSGWVLGLVGLLSALVQFIINSRSANREKKRLALIWAREELEFFEKDPVMRSALRMLDWHSSLVNLYGSESEAPSYVDEAKFCSALRVYLVARDGDIGGKPVVAPKQTADVAAEDGLLGFTRDEQAIRDIFDAFLSRIERIDDFVHNGVILKSTVESYFSYWLNLLDENGTHKYDLAHFGDTKRAAFWGFVRGYHFQGVIRLFQLYGRTVNVSPSRV